MVPSDISKRQVNNFDFLRFISSLFVIISHSYSLIGKDDQDPLLMISHNTYHFSSLGLVCFFVISGYLVSQSLFNATSILNFAWKRFLRIMPGLFGVILFSILLIGPFFTRLSLSDYFHSSLTYTYLHNIIFVFPLQWKLPGLFVNNFEKSVNGSLWSLILEGRLYILLAVLFVLYFFRKKIIPAIVFVILVIFSIWYQNIFGSASLLPFYFAVYFFAGVIAFLYKKNIKYNKWLFLLALSVIILRCFFVIVNPLIFIAFAYIILYIAQLKSPLNHYGRYGDFSYGMFLYAFPIQQCIIQVTDRNISMTMLILLSMILTLPFAFLSWKLIESKALNYKYLIK